MEVFGAVLGKKKMPVWVLEPTLVNAFGAAENALQKPGWHSAEEQGARRASIRPQAQPKQLYLMEEDSPG